MRWSIKRRSNHVIIEWNLEYISQGVAMILIKHEQFSNRYVGLLAFLGARVRNDCFSWSFLSMKLVLFNDRFETEVAFWWDILSPEKNLHHRKIGNFDLGLLGIFWPQEFRIPIPGIGDPLKIPSQSHLWVGKQKTKSKFSDENHWSVLFLTYSYPMTKMTNNIHYIFNCEVLLNLKLRVVYYQKLFFYSNFK